MEKYMIMASVAAFAIGLSLCSNFLDELPDNHIELNENNVGKILLSAYPTTAIYEMGEMSSDNTDAYPNRFSSFNRLQEDLYEWADSAKQDRDSPHALWKSCYMAISTCNEVLKVIEDAGNPASLNAEKGEALVCRAYAYFLLVNIFCNAYSSQTNSGLGTPYMKMIGTTVSPDYQRGALKEVYQNIEKDLLEGLDLVTDIYAVPKYHFIKKAVQAFAARFYLYYVKSGKSNYTKVIGYAIKVLGGNPVTSVCDWKSLGAPDIDGSVQSDVYVDVTNGVNLLLVSAGSYWGYVHAPYGLGERYAHGPKVSNETCNSVGPWGGDYYMGVWSNSSVLPTKITVMKITQYKEMVDAVAGTVNGHMVNATFTADGTLFRHVEAYAMKEMYPQTIVDLNIWREAYTHSTTPLTTEFINDFYGNMEYYAPTEFTVKKKLNPNFTITNETQENIIHCIPHVRRLTTLYEGLRWQDTKRYGITAHRRLTNDNGAITVTDRLEPNDPHRAIQIPSDATSAGLRPNPRIE